MINELGMINFYKAQTGSHVKSKTRGVYNLCSTCNCVHSIWLPCNLDRVSNELRFEHKLIQFLNQRLTTQIYQISKSLQVGGQTNNWVNASLKGLLKMGKPVAVSLSHQGKGNEMGKPVAVSLSRQGKGNKMEKPEAVSLSHQGKGNEMGKPVAVSLSH